MVQDIKNPLRLVVCLSVVLIINLAFLDLDFTSAEQKETKTKNYLRESSVTEKQNEWCPASLIQAGALTASTSLVWKKLHNQILEASYKAHPHIETLNSTQLDAYKDWVDQLFSFYTPSKLRRSIMNPAPPKQIVKLLKLAAEIRQHNANLPDVADDGDGGVKVGNKMRTLRILLMGGSVTAGIGCFWPDGINIQKPSYWAKPGERCAWSFRLEKLLNHVLFDGEKVVVVDNVSTGGQTTEFGSYVLDYRLFPKPEDVPDVVIGAFSANEAQEADLQKTFYEYNQNFVKAAQSLHPCDDKAPIIMMVDDYYGGRPFKAIVQTGNTFMLSTWNNIMSVNYGSTIKHKIEADFENESKLIPLLHSDYQIHMGAGMHSGLAWTVFFNLINSVVNVCNDMEIGIENHANDDSSSTTSSTTVLRTQRTHNQIIDPHLLQDLEKEEPSFKHIGKIKIDDKQGSVQKLHQELEENINSTKIFCDNLEKSPNASNNNTQQKVNPQRCSYSWIVNHMAGFGTKEQVNEKMSQVLLRNNGWAAEGYPVRQPRAGWYTHTPESDFSIMIKDSPIVIKYVIILSMKSYSAKWESSKLAVSTTVIKDQVVGIRKDEINEQELLIDWDGNIDDKKLFYIDGYQDIKTSVHFPHKIPISEEVKVGDSIILNAKLVSGQEFKIAGIAFCSF